MLQAYANPLIGAQASVTAPMSEYAQTPTVQGGEGGGLGIQARVIDGTPMRVATIGVLAVLGLAGLKWAGYKFNVTTG